MHGFDLFVPQFVTLVRGTHIVVTPELISEMLHVLRESHPDYPGCPRLRTVSKDKLLSLFCEIPSSWDKRQNTSCSGFAKGQRFLNMVITFFLYPFSHYNPITEAHARFLLSLIEDLTIDFPSHFILSLIYVYEDMTTRDKLIFPFAITRIIRHSFVSYPESDHFPIMHAIDIGTVRWSKVQLRPKRPWTETATPPSTSTPSFAGDVTLEAIMAQLEHMDARLGTLTTELYRVNTRAGRIAHRQAHLCGFVASPSPSPQASEDEDDDDSSIDDDDDEDEDASSSGEEEMIAFQ